MVVLSGADLVLPDRVLPQGTLVINDGRIAEIRPGTPAAAADLHGHVILPGFIDVHVHGACGVDTLDDRDSIAAMALSLPRFGVTAFCPTSMACEPAALARMLDRVRACGERRPRAARVLPAHIESGFINPEYRGAQPLHCLSRRTAAGDLDGLIRVIEDHSTDIAIVTLAPELDGAIDLIGRLCARGIRVSLGHSGASYEQAQDAIAAGATHATHLYNCMPAFHHRRPGLVGAVLESEAVSAEIVGDGVHVHPSVIAWTVAAKGADRIMAITDGTALMGYGPTLQATLGGQPVSVRDGAARLADGTLAGGVATMDRVFRNLVQAAKVSTVTAATMCATTPARQLGLSDAGALVINGVADLVVLDADLAVVRTYIAGELAYQRA
jgi:N-acetylglucosamine-6-phosphate deacetylase